MALISLWLTVTPQADETKQTCVFPCVLKEHVENTHAQTGFMALWQHVSFHR